MLSSSTCTASDLAAKADPKAPSSMAEAAEALRATADRVYAAGELPRRDGTMQPLEPVGLTRQPAEGLRDLALEHNVVRTLETGLGLGLSALALGQAILQSGHRDALHTSIDPFLNRSGHAGLDMIQRSALAPHFRLIADRSQFALPRLIESGERFDLAYVDGAHYFETAFIDLYYCMMLVNEGGLVVVDDMWMPAVRTAVAYFTSNLQCESLEPPHNRIAVLKRPATFPPDRAWDSFTPFEVATTEAR